MNALTQKQVLVLRLLRRAKEPGTPRFLVGLKFMHEPHIVPSHVHRILQALERKGLAEIVPQADGVERWRAVA